MFKHLLLPIDGSELSLMATRKAAEFASETSARITILFVKPEYPVSFYGDGAMIDPTPPDEFNKLTTTIAHRNLKAAEEICAAAGVTTTTVTETFSGTLTKNGAVTHTFVSGAAGTVTATLSLLSPDASTPIGLSLGTWNGATCAIVLANDKAIQTSVVTGNVSAVGSLCARVYDVGNLSAPASYEIQIVHP